LSTIFDQAGIRKDIASLRTFRGAMSERDCLRALMIFRSLQFQRFRLLAMALYWVAGVAGVPVFSEASSGLAAAVGPTGGYLVGFVAAAGLTGWLAKRNWDKKFLGATVSFLAGTVITFVFGMAWLAISLGADLQQALEWGFYLPAGAS
jgi:biotin transporter BioY